MFTGELFKTQKPAAAFLCNKRKALLAWEQGTGKTIISLAAAEKLRSIGKAKRSLVIGPGSFLWQWQDRIDEFTDATSILTVAKDKGTRRYEEHNADYSLIPYSLFRRDFEDILAAWKWDIAITDEAQEYRTHTTKIHSLLKRLNREMDPVYRWALTGTAITNKLEDLYSIMYWVDKNFLPSWPRFEEEHIVRNTFGGIQGYRNLTALHSYLPNRVDRKTEKDMPGQLPRIRKQVHKLEQTKESKDAHKELTAHLQSMVEDLRFDDTGALPGSTRARYPGLSKAFGAVRQAVCGDVKLRYATDLIRGLRDESSENKFVVFSYFKGPLNRLSELLHEKGFNTYRFTGDQDSVTKRENVKLFQKDPRGVLLCSNAGAAGLDLPFANQLINLDIPFAFGTLDQRIKRIVRASSKFRSVVVHYLIMEDSIEEFYFMVVLAKGAVQSAILDGSGHDEVTVRPISLRKFLMGERLDDGSS